MAGGAVGSKRQPSHPPTSRNGSFGGRAGPSQPRHHLPHEGEMPGSPIFPGSGYDPARVALPTSAAWASGVPVGDSPTGPCECGFNRLQIGERAALMKDVLVNGRKVRRKVPGCAYGVALGDPRHDPQGSAARVVSPTAWNSLARAWGAPTTPELWRSIAITGSNYLPKVVQAADSRSDPPSLAMLTAVEQRKAVWVARFPKDLPLTDLYLPETTARAARILNRRIQTDVTTELFRVKQRRGKPKRILIPNV